MKILFVIAILMTIISCNHIENKSDVAKPQNDLRISDDDNIFGEWEMCAFSGNGVMTQLNACQTIGFNRNGTGYVGKARIENFTWTLNHSSVKIDKCSTFPDTFYQASISRNKNGNDLVLSHGDHLYYLGR